MTREQQKKLREIRTALPKILQAEIKQYGFKKKDYMIWAKKGELFFTFFPSIYERDGKCFLDIRAQFKPLWVDDLLWDLIAMPENKKEPLSLRSVGAFTVYGAKLYSKEYELGYWSVEEVAEYIKCELTYFSETVQTVDENGFAARIDEPLYHADVRNLLMLIHTKQYKEAINYAERMEHDSFINGDIGLRKAAVRYCMQR